MAGAEGYVMETARIVILTICFTVSIISLIINIVDLSGGHSK